jgi:hypothetical protein
MSRLKIIGLFTIVGAVITIGSVLILSDVARHSVKDSRNEVRHSRSGAIAAVAMARSRLQEMTDEAQRSGIPAFLKTLQIHEDEIARIHLTVSKKVPNYQHHTDRKKIVEEHQDFINLFADDLVHNLTTSQGLQVWRLRKKEVFRETWRKSLVDCVARGPDKCMYDFSFVPLELFVERYSQDRTGPMQRVDLGILIDHNGTGRANTQDSNWTDKVDFSEQTVMVKHALEQEKGTFAIFDRKRAQESYFARSTPLYHQGDLVGSILVGLELDEAFAMEIKNVTRMEVMILRGSDGKQLANSSTDKMDRIQDVLLEARSALSRGVAHCAETDSFACEVLPIFSGKGGDIIQLVLWTELANAHKIPNRAKNIIIFTMLMMYLLGLLIAVVMTRNTENSFITIDQGVHEIIAGDTDYVFPFDPEEDSVANSMAQSINVMLALLQGRPIPEDDGSDNPWADSLMVDNDVRSGGRSPMELAAEPADTYYKRIYEEYRAGRLAIGQSVEDLSYVSFVERIARIERRLKNRKACRSVRFNVGVEEKQVILVPVFLSKT